MARKLTWILTLALVAVVALASVHSAAAAPAPSPQRQCNDDNDDPEAGGCSTVGGFTPPLVANQNIADIGGEDDAAAAAA
ncbi:hypothetical protein H9P43_005267 [Blastocladiella emersonii ATCC 22665]|nr:hypothetical protein H9P43_005267 [Blastocladiella emersonii ATCC 22665]